MKNRRLTKDEEQEQDHDETFLPSCCDEQGPPLPATLLPSPRGSRSQWAQTRGGAGRRHGDGKAECGRGWKPIVAVALRRGRQLDSGWRDGFVAGQVA
jgi:hypothetical protein